MRSDRKNNKAIYFVWILLGMVLAFAVTGCILSSNGSIYKFYNVGEVYEIIDSVYNVHDTQAKAHQELSGEVILDSGEYLYMMRIEDNKDKWRYFCLDLDEVKATNLKAALFFTRMEQGEVIGGEERRYDLSDGMNLLEVPRNSFNVLYLYIYGSPGASYYVNKMQLRENRPIFTWKKAIGIYAGCYAIYSLVICVFLLVWGRLGLKCRFYRLLEIVQKFFIYIASKLHKLLSKIPALRSVCRCFRTVLFAAMLIYNVFVEMQGTYKVKTKYHLLIYAIMILLIALLTIEPKLRKRNWNNALVWSWLVLWGMTCISDFFVPKNYRYLGWVMILVVGFFFFVWNNMENPYEIVQDFARAVHIFFGFVTIFCFLFRPETEFSRYLGISRNPSVFALYLGSIWAVVLGEVEQRLREQKSVLSMLPYIVEGCLAASFCWKSQSAGPVLCMLVVAFVWFLRVICYTKKARTQRKTLIAVFSFILLLVPIYGATDWGLNHIPQAVGHPITFEKDLSLAREDWDGMVVNAADLREMFAETRLGQKFARSTLSGILGSRDFYYRLYLRNMNLLGHEKNPKMWGKRRLPHNALLGIAYRYGVFAVVPYILMLGAVLIRTFRYGNKKVKYAGMPFLICLISILMSMTDNVEQPFVWLPWIALYLMMGIVFAEEG